MVAGYTNEFQLELLKFLVQDKEGKIFIPMLDIQVFDKSEHQLVLELISNYLKTYSSMPKRINLLEYWNDVVKDPKKKVNGELKRLIEENIVQVYEPMQAETKQVREKIVEFAQYKATKKLIEEYAPRIKEGVDIQRKMSAEMSRITQIGVQDQHYKEEGVFMFADSSTDRYQHQDGIPTFLRQLNRLTAAGGFFSPQLILLMGGPKAFKTGLLIKLGIELARDGYNVLYADTENGVKRIKNRIKQGYLECTTEELKDGVYQSEYLEMCGRMAKMGGELRVEGFRPRMDTANDVDARIQELKDKYGWVPDAILADYVDLFKPNDPKITEKRFQLQAVCFDFINLNKKWNVFTISPSPVSKGAVDKAVFTIKDFAEDFQKAYNCHAAFALCRTPEERAEGTARLIPVTQRDGVSYVEGVFPVPQVLLKIKESHMVVEETSFEEYMATKKEEQERKPVRKPVRDPNTPMRNPGTDKLTDD